MQIPYMEIWSSSVGTVELVKKRSENGLKTLTNWQKAVEKRKRSCHLQPPIYIPTEGVTQEDNARGKFSPQRRQ